MTWQQYIDFPGVSFYNYRRKQNYGLGRKASFFRFVKETGFCVFRRNRNALKEKEKEEDDATEINTEN